MTESSENLRARAYEARRERRLEDARRDLIASVALSRGDQDGVELASSLVGLGQIERDMGRDEVALKHYREAVELYRAARNGAKVAHTVRHVGDILRHMGRASEAEGCYREALGLYRADAKTGALDLANAIRGFAILCGDAGKVSEARELWTEARDLYAAVGVKEGVEEASRRLMALAER